MKYVIYKVGKDKKGIYEKKFLAMREFAPIYPNHIGKQTLTFPTEQAARLTAKQYSIRNYKIECITPLKTT